MRETASNSSPAISVVVIGRNEGERLRACLESISAMHTPKGGMEVIYVDSDSTDGSPDLARDMGASVICVKPGRPSAALGRNAGWQAAKGEFVLFLDGDTRLHPEFVARALTEFSGPDIAIVWGHRRESDPDQSVYVRVLDLDWIYAPGESSFCGGDALVRRTALVRVNGFDETLIAGEEPEMCRRMRACGNRIIHIDAPMTLHDLAVTSFRSYWKRAFRAGHAYAEIATRTRTTEDPLWHKESRRNFWHASALLLIPPTAILTVLALPLPVALAMAGGGILMGTGLLARTYRRCAWKSANRWTCWLYAAHSHFQQIPILFGQLAQRRDARRGRQRQLIEYKAG